MKKRVTQKAIAKRLGVSQAAVSYVLGGKGDQVSTEVSEKILVASRASGYLDQTRRSARAQKLVAFVVAKEEALHDVYHTRFLRGIQEGIQGSGYLLVHHVVTAPGDLETLTSAVSGAMVMTGRDEGFLKRLLRLMPVVVLNDRTDLEPIDFVVPDNAGGIRRAMEFLQVNGHRRFAFFGIREFHGSHAERYAEYLAMHDRLGLPKPDERWVFTPQRAAGTVEEMHALIHDAMARLVSLRPRPTALICPAD
jgi:LacI family transcriptional regulator